MNYSIKISRLCIYDLRSKYKWFNRIKSVEEKCSEQGFTARLYTDALFLLFNYGLGQTEDWALGSVSGAVSDVNNFNELYHKSAVVLNCPCCLFQVHWQNISCNISSCSFTFVSYWLHVQDALPWLLHLKVCLSYCILKVGLSCCIYRFIILFHQSSRKRGNIENHSLETCSIGVRSLVWKRWYRPSFKEIKHIY